MKHYTSYDPAKRHLQNVLLTSLTVLLPTLVMSCSLQQKENDGMPGKSQVPVTIEDLGVSLRLPEGWVEHQAPVRKILADRLEELSEEEQQTVDADHPEKFEHGANFYTYNNLDLYGSIPDDELFGYFLSIEMHDYFDETRRALWQRGQCGPDASCAESLNPDLSLIRELSSEENPFGNGTGFLYDVESEDSILATRVYIYYIVEGKTCYRVSFHGLAKDLDEGAYPELLAGIEFGTWLNG